MLEAARLLRHARRRAGLTQRALAQKAGTSQSVVGRIESSQVDPTVTTLSRLLRACETTLEALPGSGAGIDMTLLGMQLRHSAHQRVVDASAAANSMTEVFGAAR